MGKEWENKIEKKEATTPAGMKVPLKPTAMVNYKMIDNALAKIAANFWKLIWDPENPAIDQKTKYLLSLANAVGAGRFRQATRELVKAYAAGVTVAELDELFRCLSGVRELGPFPLRLVLHHCLVLID